MIPPIVASHRRAAPDEIARLGKLAVRRHGLNHCAQVQGIVRGGCDWRFQAGEKNAATDGKQKNF
jgi:hypothetical protein